ncbi:Protein eva-1 [Parelaphostrongylus tenuis]|uniref:Protein eva-1 n=1 Tax=Parelaphostrongylus tenuis TaxID=148309 RepID=A0AAD5QYC8_PARTN|nr:Protein eva-1 [Parelaphostrongylus tenuis]
MMDTSLRSHRVQACDGEKVTLHCPRNTHIIIETGFYGRVVPESQLCPGRIPGRKGYDATCDVIQAKTRLSELCDKKRKCTVYVDTTTFEDDPCPSTSKYLQMSYKCRPVLFDGESFCEGAEMHLECREGRRLAIYSANYGRSAHTQAAHCTAPVHFTKGENDIKHTATYKRFFVVVDVNMPRRVDIIQ